MQRLATWWLLLGVGCALALTGISALDEDLQFEETGTTSAPAPSSTPAPVVRLWGIPDMQAVVGKLFVATIPPDAFSGKVQFFEEGGHNWPRWVSLSAGGELKGVPTASDVGVAYLMVRAVGPHAHHYSKDTFAVEVIKPGLDTLLPQSLDSGDCPAGVDPFMLTSVLSTELRNIAPARRVTMIETIAAYYGVDTGRWYLREVTSLRDDPTVVAAGPGNVAVPDGHNLAALSIQIGCGREVRKELDGTATRISSDAHDGTLAEVLQVPIARWFTHTELPTFFRDRREVGSGDFFQDNDEEEEDDYGEREGVTVGGVAMVTVHPHRHHHGEDGDVGEGTVPNSVDTPEVELLPSEVFYQRPASTLLMNYDNIISTPPFIPERPTVGLEAPSTIIPTATISATPTVSVTPTSVATPPRTTGARLDVTTPDDLTTLTTKDSGAVVAGTNMSEQTTVSGETFAPTWPVDLSSSSGSSSSSSLTPASSTHKEDETPAGGSFTTQLTTEDLEPEDKNFPPAIGQRLQKVQLFAGSALRLQLPENTFTDVEDGSTSHLTVTLTSMDGRALPPDDWIMYNSTSREILALTWELHVQTWEFLLTASDKDGDSVSDTLAIHVQQHKRVRTVNHVFSVSVRLARGAYTHAVQWELDLLAALAAVYGDTDPSRTIVVRGVVLGSDVNTFTWTNDTLPHEYCPEAEIEQILKVISEDGYPTAGFAAAVGRGMTVSSITYKPLKDCEPVRPVDATSVAPPLAPPINFPPLFRNQVDQINATAGQLLIFRVPEDSLYDPEDGGTRELKMTLLQADRAPLSPKHWLQFDSKNQEFYGLPMDKDVRSVEYQLVCEDRGGLSANDVLLVLVRPRIYRRYSVEFSIALDVPYEKFQSTARLKRKFVQNIQELFKDSNPDSIVVHTISPGATSDVTTIKWYNSSLPSDRCPEEQIFRLRKRISNDDGRISNDLLSAFGSELPVVSVGLEPEGECQGGLTVLHETPHEHPAAPDDTFRPMSKDDYILTFVIPIAVIALMLCLAGLVACLLYRKRHVAKLGAGDEAERHSFRNKGIPVIFQDEWEEKPEPENKPPVIMKEEKPPLPPPEYRGGSLGGSGDAADDTPYHPPPPFPASRDSNRSARPKPTPTYRKPPPYVPP